MGLRTPKRGLRLPQYHMMALLELPKISGNPCVLPFNSAVGRENNPIPVPLDSNNACLWNLNAELLQVLTERVLIKGCKEGCKKQKTKNHGLQTGCSVATKLGRTRTFWCVLSSWVTVDNYVLYIS